MRTSQEILNAMSKEMRANAEETIAEVKSFAMALFSIPSPTVLAGQTLDERAENP